MNRHLMTAVVALSTLTLAACSASTPGAPSPTSVASASPGSMLKPLVVVTTTARRLDPSAVATLTASSLLDIPDGYFLLLEAMWVEDVCMSNCQCPEPIDTSWNQLSPTDRGQAMRDMIRQGARGFIDLVDGRRLTPCACDETHQQRKPIQKAPFSWYVELAPTLLRADRDGSVVVKLGDETHVFKPGDKWTYSYANPDPGLKLSECDGGTLRRTMSFENRGLLDESQFPELSQPAPTPVPFSSQR